MLSQSSRWSSHQSRAAIIVAPNMMPAIAMIPVNGHIIRRAIPTAPDSVRTLGRHGSTPTLPE